MLQSIVNRNKPIEVYEILEPFVCKSPVRRIHWLEKMVGHPVWVKLENYQHTGSFKYRGARYTLRNQEPEQKIIAASAGNHGFAVAEISRQLGLTANICLPCNSSRIKREHIISTGMGLIEYGTSLDEAIDHARKLADERNWRFISPYNDVDVILGNSSLAVEFLEQVPEISTFITPIGGGGLISGMAIGAESLNRNIEILGCEPELYNSLSQSIEANKITKIVHQPTFADGLAVNLEQNSITFELVKEYVKEIVTLSEEELAAATLAFLVHESLLVEPAGAAGVIACLKFAREGKIRGPVGIPLCGGNIQHGNLTKIQKFPFSDPDLLQLLNLRGQKIKYVTISKKYYENDAVIPVNINNFDNLLLSQVMSCVSQLQKGQKDLDDYEKYCNSKNLLLDKSSVQFIRKTCDESIECLNDKIKILSDLDTNQSENAVIESTLRVGLNSLAFMYSALEWCSSSYNQSIIPQFFRLGSQENPAVNYERYEHTEIHRIENQILEVLNLPTDLYHVTVTSSGMSSYSLIESYILREILKDNPKIVTSPYIYFESEEQLFSLPFVDVIRANDYSVESIIEQIEAHKPSVIFIDPLANTSEQRLIDIDSIIKEIKRRKLFPITVVIDGTMVSGAIDRTWFSLDDEIEVIYYESCSKYFQLGLDMSMAGFVAHPTHLRPRFERLRRNTGAILSRGGAYLFPVFNRSQYYSRMKRICNNAVMVSQSLYEDLEVRKFVNIYYPGHKSHQDYAISQQLPYAGGCVTFKPLSDGENNRDQLESFIEYALHLARKRELQLTKGVSFGFSVPRISAASSMAEQEAPFLRLYVGDPSKEQMQRLISVIKESFRYIVNL